MARRRKSRRQERTPAERRLARSTKKAWGVGEAMAEAIIADQRESARSLARARRTAERLRREHPTWFDASGNLKPGKEKLLARIH